MTPEAFRASLGKRILIVFGVTGLVILGFWYYSCSRVEKGRPGNVVEFVR